MTVERICEYLAARVPADIPIVVGELPSLTAEGVAIHSPGFDPNASFFGAAETTLWRPLIRFFIRTTTYPLGQEWAESLRETFHKFHDAEVLSMNMIGTPVYLGRNPENLFEFQLTFNTFIRSD